MIKTLIVDDDAKFRRLVKRILSNDSRMAVIGEANSGHEAITKARVLMLDLVLMDVRMPEMNGIDATRLLKKEMPKIRVILLSPYDFDEYRKAAKAAGVVCYISKKEIYESRASDPHDRAESRPGEEIGHRHEHGH